jgi:AcrR family transcriptional regulator
MPRRSPAAVAATRAAVTKQAVDRASIDGLEGLTIGGLAEAVEMRKSSVFSLFGSKQELQRAAFDAAIEQFRREVWDPAAERPSGRERLLALCEAWLSYHEREVLPGGCFMTTATIEYDAQPGPMRDLIARTMEQWLAALEREAAIAVDRGELPPDADPGDIAFQLNAIASAASYGFQLWRDRTVFDRARRSMRRLLVGAKAPPRGDCHTRIPG